jgi:hypothetical protein
MPLSYQRKEAPGREKEMRKFILTVFPASLLLACLAMILSTCGGGGGGGGAPPATLSGLSINGPSSVSEYGTGTYTATANWSDNSISTITPVWSINHPAAKISGNGVLSCQLIDNDETVTVTATLSSGGITKTATMDVTLANIVTVPFTAQMVSGAILFNEGTIEGGGYESSLYKFNADFSFEQYHYENPPDTSEDITGTWNIDASGKLLVNVNGQGTITVELIGDLLYVPRVSVDDGTGNPYTVLLERSGPGPYPFENSLIPGTYVNQFGDTWIFNPNGTGSTTGDGGWTFTWSVDSGILKVVFPNQYVGSMYLRQTTQSSPTSYATLKWAFVIHTPTGAFGSYYGGMELTRR